MSLVLPGKHSSSNFADASTPAKPVLLTIYFYSEHRCSSCVYRYLRPVGFFFFPSRLRFSFILLSSPLSRQSQTHSISTRRPRRSLSSFPSGRSPVSVLQGTSVGPWPATSDSIPKSLRRPRTTIPKRPYWIASYRPIIIETKHHWRELQRSGELSRFLASCTYSIRLQSSLLFSVSCSKGGPL